jgi:hypothetical protein
MRAIAGLPHLEWLVIDGTRITDFKLLAGMKRLRFLGMCQMQFTDMDILHLTELRELRELYLNDTKITDVGLTLLVGLNNLHRLVVGGTKVTEDGVSLLQGALPRCRINR